MVFHQELSPWPPPTFSAAPADQPRRMAIYCHDTYGLGRLRRCLKICRAFSGIYPELSILLLTGSPHAGRYRLPEGVDLVQLPAVAKHGSNSYQPRSLGISLKEILELREKLIFEAVRTFNPHFMLVDRSHIGMNTELCKTLSWLKEQNTQCQVALGLRDIIDEPEKVIAAWQAENIYEVLEHVYDQIFIYGTPEVFDPVSEYNFGPAARAKTSYTGFITDCAGKQAMGAEVGRCRNTRDTKKVFLTVGGGEDGPEIVETFLSMLSQYRSRLQMQTTVVTGPFFPQRAKTALATVARELKVEFSEFLPDISYHLRRADLVISMGGYNTVTEILAAARKALIIPRIYPNHEQIVRADRLAKLGLINYISPEGLDSNSLFEAVSPLLSEDDQPLVEARQRHALPLDGTSRLADLCRPILEQFPDKVGSGRVGRYPDLVGSPVAA